MQMAVMLVVLALYDWKELAVYAAASVAAATPKRRDAEVVHPTKVPATFSQSPSELVALRTVRTALPDALAACRDQSMVSHLLRPQVWTQQNIN